MTSTTKIQSSQRHHQVVQGMTVSCCWGDVYTDCSQRGDQKSQQNWESSQRCLFKSLGRQETRINEQWYLKGRQDSVLRLFVVGRCIAAIFQFKLRRETAGKTTRPDNSQPHRDEGLVFRALRDVHGASKSDIWSEARALFIRR